MSAGRVIVLSSELSLLETLVLPLRTRNDTLIQSFRNLLLNSRGVRLLPITRATLERAAQLRADTGLRTPDALHVASAAECNADTLVTNDANLARAAKGEVVLLSDLATGA